MRTILLAIVLSTYCLAFSQSEVDTSMLYSLSPLEIHANQFDLNKSLISQQLLKTNPNQNLASLLQKQSGIYVRSRGSGSLSTPSYKGLGSERIPVNINGVNIQSSMNGTLDLSLINAFHFSDFTVETADRNILGQQNIGESITLTQTNKGNQIEVNSGFNSLLTKSLGAKYSRQKEKVQYVLSIYGEQSPNLVTLNHYGVDSTQANTDYFKWSVLQTLKINVTKDILWENSIFLQSSDRAVPRTFIDLGSDRIGDKNALLINKLSNSTRHLWKWNITNAVGRQEISFDDRQADRLTTSKVWNVNTNIGLERKFSEHMSFISGLSNDLAFYQSEAIQKDANWNRFRFCNQLKYKQGKLKYLLDFGLATYNAQVFSNAKFSLDYLIIPSVKSSLSLQKVFRLPTLNELYWYEPGRAFGNDTIGPENGCKADYNLSYSEGNFQFSMNPHIGFYQNWIEWRGFPVIRPRNIKNVAVGGNEVDALYKYTIGENKITAQTSLHWVRARYVSEPFTLDGENQLIFTPEYTASSTLTYSAVSWSSYINLMYAGTNYVTSDNSGYLDPYWITEIGGFYETHKWRFSASVSNLFNQAYFSQPNTPVPGRVFHINLNCKIPNK